MFRLAISFFLLAFLPVRAVAAEGGEAFRLQGNALADKGQFDAAHRLFVRSCARNDAKGCYNLALAEIRGEGTRSSCVTGHIYFSKSCKLGFQNACEAIGRLPKECGQPFQNPERAASLLCQLAGDGSCEASTTAEESSEGEAEPSESDDNVEYDSDRRAEHFKQELKARQQAFDRKLEAQREARREDQRREQRRQEQLDAQADERRRREADLQREYDRRRQEEQDRQREYDRQRASW